MMDRLNELNTSALPLQPASHPARYRITLIIAAWVEIIVGVSFILATNTQSQFVFGSTPDAMGVLFARLAGIGLIELGIACLPSFTAHRTAVRGLFIFNIAATIFFGWVLVATTFHGVMLCPVIILHAGLAIALTPLFRHENS